MRTWAREGLVRLHGSEQPTEQKSGLLGYISCTYGDIRLDGLAVRRTMTGDLTLSYPARRDRVIQKAADYLEALRGTCPVLESLIEQGPQP